MKQQRHLLEPAERQFLFQSLLLSELCPARGGESGLLRLSMASRHQVACQVIKGTEKRALLRYLEQIMPSRWAPPARPALWAIKIALAECIYNTVGVRGVTAYTTRINLAYLRSHAPKAKPITDFFIIENRA